MATLPALPHNFYYEKTDQGYKPRYKGFLCGELSDGQDDLDGIKQLKAARRDYAILDQELNSVPRDKEVKRLIKFSQRMIKAINFYLTWLEGTDLYISRFAPLDLHEELDLAKLIYLKGSENF